MAPCPVRAGLALTWILYFCPPNVDNSPHASLISCRTHQALCMSLLPSGCVGVTYLRDHTKAERSRHQSFVAVGDDVYDKGCSSARTATLHCGQAQDDTHGFVIGIQQNLASVIQMRCVQLLMRDDAQCEMLRTW
ncbi:hypothetical protein L210DRAFT_2227977 [Boletus edulis BED1]|uniref:Uncharacterized protein n=1 Tax=Boletus edulis BED1 TaxID=1328754 RepID=A0AAD4BCT0_BOLED|nr:hypothetical protein L210DRAFT_2227977 [Boletus edulis BED1]